MQRNCTRSIKDEYHEKRRVEKQIHRRKKRVWKNKQIEHMESLRSRNEARKFYRLVNNERKPYIPRISIIKDEDGNIISEEQQVLKRWCRHFDDLLNRRIGENRKL